LDSSASASYDRQSTDKIVLSTFPTPLAFIYQQLLIETNWHAKTDIALNFFEMLMWALDLELLRNYLNPLTQLKSNDELDKVLQKSLREPSLGDLVSYFFFLLGTHKEHPNWFFIREEYDLYWVASTQQKKEKVQGDFLALVPIRNELSHGAKPVTDEQWRVKYKEVEPLLLRIVSRFEFLQYYDVLYILSLDKNQASSISLRGTTPTPVKVSIPEDVEIKPHQFYLRDMRDNRLTLLSPLFLPWPSDLFKLSEPRKTGDENQLAMYAKYYQQKKDNEYKILYQVVTSAITKLELVEGNVFSEFLEQVIYRVEAIRQKILAAKKLGWDLFARIASDINEIEVQGVKEKFESELYYERGHIRKMFDHFLQSDKTALVLLGDSGVGKSNFLLSLTEIYRGNNNICIIFLNSSRLIGEQDLGQQLTNKFSKRLKLVDTRGERTIQNIFEELAHIPEIKDKKIVFMFDGINENSNPDFLLRELDDLVAYLNFPWLKVVVTSRPETWQSMKRGIVLTEARYYRQPDALAIEVEPGMENIVSPNNDGWLKLERFNPAELPNVYERYQKRYQLANEYDSLSLAMKIFLRDPLALKLIAETSEGKSLPDNVQAIHLYEDYINNMIDREKLKQADINIFLKQQILPLMLRPGAYSLRLGVGLLSTTIDPESGRPLSEKIERDDYLASTQRRINQSFQNLVDAGILIKTGNPSNYEIGFKYERFYEYYVGEYLHAQNKGQVNKIEAYQKLIDEMKGESPFLWGGIKNALFREFVSGEVDLIQRLAAGKEDQSVRELLITVLTERGNELDGASSVEAMIAGLLKIDRKHPGIVASIRVRLTGNDGILLSPGAKSASAVALEVARRLSLVTILESAAIDPSPSIRLAAIRNIYHLWRNDNSGGYALLERLVEKITAGGVFPNIPALESCMGIFIVMMRHYYPDTPDGRELGAYLLAQMQKITRKLFFVGDANRGWKRFWIPVARTFILNALVRFIVSTQEAYPPEKPSFLREVGDLIKAEPAVKARYDRLVGYFEHPTGIANIRSDLFDAVEDNDTLTSGVIWLLIIFDFIDGRETDYTVLEELAARDLQAPQVGITNESMIIALGLIGLYKNDTSDQFFQQLKRMTIAYIERTKGFYFSKSGTRHPNLAINPYSTARRLRQIAEDDDLVAFFLAKARDQKDWTFFAMLLDSLVTQSSYADDLPNIRMALQSFRTVFPIPAEVEDKAALALARIRLYNREEVDNFLLDVDTESKILPKVLRIEPDEQVWGELFHNFYSTILIRLLQTKEIKVALVSLLKEASHQNSLNEYLNIAVKDVMNLLTGEQIFRPKKSRGNP
jgi:hypothetical protein